MNDQVIDLRDFTVECLSHGASGFAVAFARYFRATSNQKYRDACLSALAFERSLFVPSQSNWLDRRDAVIKGGGEQYGDSWAHGAPGIGIARLAIYNSGIVTDQIIEEATVATRKTLDLDMRENRELAVVSGGFGRLELPLLYPSAPGTLSARLSCHERGG